MELRDYLSVMWRRRWIIAIAVCLCAGISLALSLRQPPLYVATAKVFIGAQGGSGDPNSDLSSALQQLTYSREFMASYAEQFRSRNMAEEVVERLGVDLPPVSLVERVEAQIVPDTRIITVSVENENPKLAQSLANTYAETFVEEGISALSAGGGVTARVFESALAPNDPVSPQPIRDGLIGLLLGVFLGFGLSVVLERFDTTIQTEEDVERALGQVPVLATIPTFSGPKGRKVWISTDPHSPTAEAFRILRTSVESLGAEGVKTLLVASSHPGDGKTTVAVNLAAAMAAAGYRTLLIEADLRKPVLREQFSIPAGSGLSELLRGQTRFENAVVDSGIPNLSLLLSGSVPPNPAELLSSHSMTALMEDLRGSADVVIFDTPPSLPVTDATVVARVVDAVIIVARAGKTHAHGLQEAKRRFDSSNEPVLGIVLNGVEREGTGSYYYYYRQGVTASSRASFHVAPNQRELSSALSDLKPASISGSQVRNYSNGEGTQGPKDRIPGPSSVPSAPPVSGYPVNAKSSETGHIASEAPMALPSEDSDMSEAIRDAVNRGKAALSSLLEAEDARARHDEEGGRQMVGSGLTGTAALSNPSESNHPSTRPGLDSGSRGIPNPRKAILQNSDEAESSSFDSEGFWRMSKEG